MFSVDPLTRPDNLVFPSNLIYRDLRRSGGRLRVEPSGHCVVYGAHGRRILGTDPDGHPLHECEWAMNPDGQIHLLRARIRLDWGQWIGIRPCGLTNETVLDLSRRPGWQRLHADDLRRMAAQALHVPLDEVRFFYTDRDLLIDRQGRATIRHHKDAFYVLKDGTFADARFMACMGAMHWSLIDFLPVVELFQSLLPGTGSAAFELIRALYDDQNRESAEPRCLRYRGIPTYPSEAAFRLFSLFFRPDAPGDQEVFPLFMDPARSHEVTWLPTADPPRRYFGPSDWCVTIHGTTVQKATAANDESGLSFTNSEGSRFAPYGRRLSVMDRTITVQEGSHVRTIAAPERWGPLRALHAAPDPGEARDVSSWRALFRDGPPRVAPRDAFSAVLLYPEDETEIDERASQAFVADYLQDLTDEQPELRTRVQRATHVLIDRFEAAVLAVVQVGAPTDYSIVYDDPPMAQRQAQQLWNQAAKTGALNGLSRVEFRTLPQHDAVYGRGFDLLYGWIPFAKYGRMDVLNQTLAAVTEGMRTDGFAWLVGPEVIERLCGAQRLQVVYREPVSALPTFHMHRSIVPRARLKEGMTLFGLTRIVRAP